MLSMAIAPSELDKFEILALFATSMESEEVGTVIAGILSQVPLASLPLIVALPPY